MRASEPKHPVVTLAHSAAAVELAVTSTRPRRVLHVITGLETGGAEAMLLKLVREAQAGLVDSSVVSLSGEGTSIGAELRALGIPLWALGVGGDPRSLRGFGRLGSIVREADPEVLQGWMYHGNLAALAAKRWARSGTPVVWNIRQTSYSLRDERPLTAALIRIGGTLSRHARAIVYNSRLSALQHRKYGYAAERERLISNGFDEAVFRRMPEARSALLAELALPAEVVLIGLVARFHPMKNHVGFLAAAAMIRRACPRARFVLVGRGMDAQNETVAAAIREHELDDSVYLLGARSDLPGLNSAFDIGCSNSSWGDAFPNVVGEAMACETPCVVTDVGDAAAIVGVTGLVVPPDQPAALAAACLELVTAGCARRAALGARARQRVLDQFTISHVAQQYAALYNQVAAT